MIHVFEPMGFWVADQKVYVKIILTDENGKPVVSAPVRLTQTRTFESSTSLPDHGEFK
ncbi:MAG: hypothetical protein LBG65_04445 [Puniceicoccales bacterium]|nr:hypothetical protein [Puniceicoccales bacterium]